MTDPERNNPHKCTCNRHPDSAVTATVKNEIPYCPRCGGIVWPKFGKDNNGHDGDCTVYSSMQNNHITDGICTCGYGHRQQTSESFAMDNMYSQERISEGLERKDNNEFGHSGDKTVSSYPEDNQHPPKERKVSLEEIVNLMVDYRYNVADGAIAIQSLFNATEERKGEE